MKTTGACNVINIVLGMYQVFQNGYYFYYYHKGRLYHRECFPGKLLSENLKNGKKLAGKEEKKNGTCIMQKGPGSLRELERGQKQFSKERSLSNLLCHQRLTWCQKVITARKENFMPRGIQLSARKLIKPLH